ncbi:hypothetical protein ACFU8I_25720 [Streptomyces sp. NPDC057540]|uniref:hypothetical protein n=1 Tax=Streptomyces sp. NPDC057540 TaxID=3346160 RepID=UPI0036CA79AB
MLAWILGALVPLGVAAIVLGVIAFRTGWVMRPTRRWVRRPRLYGVGAALAGVGLLYMAATYFVLAGRPDGLGGHPWLALAGNGVELVGLVMIAASQLRPRRGRAAHPVA